jgi:hypothetical protein
MSGRGTSWRSRWATATCALLVLAMAVSVGEPAARAATAPRVTTVNPGSGLGAGGNVVTLTGSGFSTSSTVTFGSVKSPRVTYVSSSRLYAKAPAHSLGQVHVHVTTSVGRSASMVANRYVFTARPITPVGGRVRTVLSQWGDPTDMSCPTPTFCMLVDRSGAAVITDGTSAGTRTVISHIGSLPFFLADSVECGSPTFCIAWDGNSTSPSMRTYDGTGWSALEDLPAGAHLIDCVSAAFCLGVNGTSWSEFDGTDWTTQSQPAGSSQWTSLTCVSSTFCLATTADGHTWRYTGAAWTDQGATLSSGGSGQSVACASSAYCVGLEFGWFGTKHETRFATFNGTSWSALAPVPGSDAVHNDSLAGFSCAAGPQCFALSPFGDIFDFDGASWQISRPLDPFGATPIGGECITATLCRIVYSSGFARAFDSSAFGDPVEIDTPRGAITSISCTSMTFCAVVDAHGWARTFNGATWDAPARIALTARFTSVSCPSALACVAVDQAGRASRYNGSTWSTPTEIDPNGSLNAVSCPNPDFCMAVDSEGYVVAYSNGHWHTPRLISSTPLADVSCSSITFCYAVGGVVIRYTGSWGSPHYVGLSTRDVSCTSPKFCMAGFASYRIGLQTYTGVSWSRPTPLYGIEDLDFQDMSCATPRYCVISTNGGGAPTYQVIDGAAVGYSRWVVQYDDRFISVSCWDVGQCMIANQTSAKRLG